MDYRKSTRVSVKSHPQFNEKWLQQQIASDVTLIPRTGRVGILAPPSEAGLTRVRAGGQGAVRGLVVTQVAAGVLGGEETGTARGNG